MIKLTDVRMDASSGTAHNILCDIVIKYGLDAVLMSLAEIITAQQERANGFVIVVYKDGSWVSVEPNHAWEYQNDPDWLTTIPAKNIYPLTSPRWLANAQQK